MIASGKKIEANKIYEDDTVLILFRIRMRIACRVLIWIPFIFYFLTVIIDVTNCVQ